VIVSFWGTGAVFVLNALSYLGVIWVLARWRCEASASELPSERFFGALRTGLRFARHAPELQAAVVRGLGFFLFASASWALLPLVARDLVNGGSQAFGILVASLGVGAVAGALLLPRLRERVSRDALVAGATLLYGLATLALSALDRLWPLALAMVMAGIAWISVLSSLQVAAQMVLSNWVRSLGLAVFMAAFMGSMALGSLLWGKLADLAGIPISLQIAAVGLVLAVALTWRWRISGLEAVNLSPSMRWPAPIVPAGVTHDNGPVLITVHYEVDPKQIGPFLRSVRTLGRRRRRDGALAWGVFEDTERPNRFIESFCVESWLKHLRQHERVTDDDRILQERIRGLLVEGTVPRVSHYVAPSEQSIAGTAAAHRDSEATP
jgi:hypothetical protein